MFDIFVLAIVVVLGACCVCYIHTYIESIYTQHLGAEHSHCGHIFGSCYVLTVLPEVNELIVVYFC